MYEYFVQNAVLSPYSTYRIGGNAKYLAQVYDLDGLLRAMELSDNRLILGRGSKVLISDSGFDGVVILVRFSSVKFGKDVCGDNEGNAGKPIKNAGRLTDGFSASDCGFDKITEGEKYGEKICGFGGAIGHEEVYAEAGVSLPMLSRIYAARGLKGLEWACGIPANIGGALKLNAGAFGGDMSQVVLYTDVLRKGLIVRLPQSECGFAYRYSGFYPSDVILGAGLKAQKGDSDVIAALSQNYARKRREAQPKGFCCGSVFKAADLPAYAYIQECGLKGLAVGDAVISEKHGNFIINNGSATARDVYTLIRTIKAEVYVRFGVKLKEEVVYAGEF